MYKHVQSCSSLLSKIAVANTHDSRGGAAIVARNQSEFFKAQGIEVTFFTGAKKQPADWIVKFPTSFKEKVAILFSHFISKTGLRKLPSFWRIESNLRKYANNENFTADAIGREKFNFMGTRLLLSLKELKYELLHLHNLHGNYFDLRLLPNISNLLPTFITLHDAWLLSGHCAHSFDCQRWQIGCGLCPYLDAYPGIKHDESSSNWKKKSGIYQQSSLYIISPCKWLATKIRQSMLMPAVRELRVIPNGIDIKAFFPRNKSFYRRELGLSREEFIVLFAAQSLRSNPFKDFATLQGALKLLENVGQEVLCICAGDKGKSYQHGKVKVQFTGFLSQRVLAQYYAAADLYIHPSKADTSPLAILEAMASGLPVVASDVGGIAELLIDLKANPGTATGMLVPPGNSHALAESILHLLSNKQLGIHLGNNAVARVKNNFTLERQMQGYFDFYQDVLA